MFQARFIVKGQLVSRRPFVLDNKSNTLGSSSIRQFLRQKMTVIQSFCLVVGLVLSILINKIPGIVALSMSASRFFLKSPKQPPTPSLILIAGSPGTGKSTFAMSVALDLAILKCISTDTIRATMRSFVSPDISPALHRSSFAEAFEGDCPVRSWKETCSVLSPSLEGLIDDAMKRRISIVVEGVHVVPNNDLIQKWKEAGGTAVGVLLQVQNEEKHKRQLRKRGVMTGVIAAEERKIASFDRIRSIQDEMMRLAKESRWIQIEQRTALDPLELIESVLSGDEIFSEVETTEETNDMETLVAIPSEVNGSVGTAGL